MIDPTDGLPPERRLLAMMSLGVAVCMAVLDGSIANIALPTIARELQASPAGSIWVVNAYQLAVTISLLPLASLGDVHGHRRIFRWGLLLYTLASIGCAMSTTLPELVAGRVLQGFGGAGIMSVNGALVRFIFPRSQLGPGHRLQRAGGGDIIRGGPLRGGGDHGVCILAVAVRHPGTVWRRVSADVDAVSAAFAADVARVRRAQCGDERDDVGPVHHRTGRDRPW